MNQSGISVVIPLYVKPQITFHGQSGRVSVMVGSKASVGNRQIEDVVVTIPFPKTVLNANLSANFGTVQFDDTTKARGGWVLLTPAGGKVGNRKASEREIAVPDWGSRFGGWISHTRRGAHFACGFQDHHVFGGRWECTSDFLRRAG